MAEMWPTSVAMPVAVTMNSPGAAGDVGVHVDHVGAVAERRVRRRDRSTPLRHRQALAGERRLGDLERGGAQQAPVGGDDVAGLDRDDVAGHELLGRQLGQRSRRGARAP